MQDKDTKDISHDVFISYATDKGDFSTSKDIEVAEKVCTALESKNIRCWLAPRSILPGDAWLDAIPDAIDKSRAVVLVFSANANHSQWVKDEVTLALSKNIKIIPFRIEDVSPEGGLRILQARCQWLDAYTPPMEKHVDRLVTMVCRHLGEEPEEPIEEIPGYIKVVQSKTQRVYKNEKGFREADYGDGIVMVYIPPGEFTMGSNDNDREKPPHQIYLDGYWLGKYAVTFAQYDKYCRETRQKKPDDEGWNRGKRPVINVSWHDAAAYCKWLSEKTALTFKLPSEAQWEKAARGTGSRKYPWGDQMPDEDLANFSNHIGKTSPAGSYPQGESPYGNLDMAGNVWEWCNDWFDRDYYKHSPGKNPPGPGSGSYRVLRGGSRYNDAASIRCAFRGWADPSRRLDSLGFRLCQVNC